MKRLIVVLIVLAALGGGGWWWYSRQAAAKADTPAVTTAKVERGPIRQSVPSTGKVVSNLDVDIKCKASGRIIRLPFDVSDTVRKGDLLVELDPVDEQRAVAKATTALAASQARLATAKQNLLIAQQNLATAGTRAQAALESARIRAQDTADKAHRMDELLAKKLASTEEDSTAKANAAQAVADLENARAAVADLKALELGLENKRQEIAQAQAQVDSDQIALSDARQRLDDTKVVAAMDGVVAARNVQLDQIISSAITNVGGGTAVLTLSDLSRIFVSASVDESDIGRVRVGQKVLITVDAYPGQKFTGQVVRIATRGVNVSNVVTFEVKIEVTGEGKSMLKPEMTANVETVVDEKEDVLTVPVEAVTRKAGKQHITLAGGEGGKDEDRVVTVGITDGTRYEIKEGVAEGDTVVLKKADAASKWRADQGSGSGSRSGGLSPRAQMRVMGGGDVGGGGGR